MPANYPGAVTPIPLLDPTLPHIVTADDFNRTREEVNAIEAELGVNPSGTYQTVTERLAVIAAQAAAGGGQAAFGLGAPSLNNTPQPAGDFTTSTVANEYKLLYTFPAMDYKEKGAFIWFSIPTNLTTNQMLVLLPRVGANPAATIIDTTDSMGFYTHGLSGATSPRQVDGWIQVPDFAVGGAVGQVVSVYAKAFNTSGFSNFAVTVYRGGTMGMPRQVWSMWRF